jgi:DNA-binding winged helix-turn-helix (wHTH) protein
MSEQSRPTYEFGPFSVDASKRLLLRNGEPVPLAPKVLETLLALIQNRERVLTKDELLKQVWGDTIVEEEGSPGTSPCCGRHSGIRSTPGSNRPTAV